MKPVMFFDFDETLVSTKQVIIDFVARQYGVQLPFEGYLWANSLAQTISKYLPPGKELSNAQYYEDGTKHFVCSYELHAKAVPMPEAEIYIPRLAKKYDLWIATARQEVGRPLVTDLCQKFFGNSISGAHFVWKKFDTRGSVMNKSKRDFISDFQGEKVAFFDDNPHEIRETQDLIPAHLFDPFDYHVELTDIKRRTLSFEKIADTYL